MKDIYKTQQHIHSTHSHGHAIKDIYRGLKNVKVKIVTGRDLGAKKENNERDQGVSHSEKSERGKKGQKKGIKKGHRAERKRQKGKIEENGEGQ